MSELRYLTSSDDIADRDTSAISVDREALYDANTSRKLLHSSENTLSTSGHVSFSESRRPSEHLHSNAVFDRLRNIFERPVRYVEGRKMRLHTEETERLPLYYDPRTVNDHSDPTQRGHARKHANNKYINEATDSFEIGQSELRGQNAFDFQDKRYNSNIILDTPLCQPLYCSKHCDTDVTPLDSLSSEHGISCKCQTEIENNNKAIISKMHTTAPRTATEEKLNFIKSIDTCTETNAIEQMDTTLATTSRKENAKAKTKQDTLIRQLKERNMQPLEDAEIIRLLKLDKNYNSLKNLFAALTVMNMILIVCVVLGLSVLLKHFKSDYEIRQIVSEQLSSIDLNSNSSVYCVPCRNLDQTLSIYFKDIQDERCCIEDISKVFTALTKLTEQKHGECQSRLSNLENENEGMLSDIINIKMKILNTSDLEGKEDWLKHPEILGNNKLINLLLTRRRSAIHLKGIVKRNGIEWTADISEGKLTQYGNGVSVENGGMYYVYSIIRYKKNSCSSNGKVGYDVKRRTGVGPAVPIASVYNDCANGTHNDQGLIIQRVFQLTVGQNSEVFIDIGEFIHGRFVEEEIHSFGIFEL